MARRCSRPAAPTSSRALAVALMVALLVGCAPRANPADDPDRRAVHIDTRGCEAGSDTFGSGVVFGEVIVTVAHLVVEAETLTVSIDRGPELPARVLAADLQQDLAAIHVDGLDETRVETALADQGGTGRIVDAATSGTVAYEVKRRVSLRIEDVGGSDRHSRIGYELEAATADGDSGAGAFDQEGRLIGIVFASGEDGQTTWLTASSEIEDFLDDVRTSDAYEPCS